MFSRRVRLRLPRVLATAAIDRPRVYQQDFSPTSSFGGTFFRAARFPSAAGRASIWGTGTGRRKALPRRRYGRFPRLLKRVSDAPGHPRR